MRTLLLIGIGAGDPQHLTEQAAAAIGSVDVFFVVDKGGQADELVALRKEILARHAQPGSYRIVELDDPPRDRRPSAYGAEVERWRARRAELWEQAIGEHLGEDGRGGFLVWGDPSLYDSTIAVLERIRDAGRVELEWEVIPGISSIHALTARHRIPLNRVGGSVLITTGRRLAAHGVPDGVDDVVVMLDADCSFKRIDPDGIDIYWGAYLGTTDELLVSGSLAEMADEIERVRTEARARKGWIMDTYLLRRRRAGSPDAGSR